MGEAEAEAVATCEVVDTILEGEVMEAVAGEVMEVVAGEVMEAVAEEVMEVVAEEVMAAQTMGTDTTEGHEEEKEEEVGLEAITMKVVLAMEVVLGMTWMLMGEGTS